MNILVTAPRSLAGYFFAESTRISINRCIRSFVAALILMFAGNAYAVIVVGLSIENDLDSNGNITVINGGKVNVAYTVIQDDDKDLNKKDKIQLLRVSDDSIVASVVRGKKKSGTISIKVKNSEGEQLYVRYVRKTGTQIARTSHPGDAGIPLLSIAKASLADLTVRLNAMESAPSRIEFSSTDSSIQVVDTSSAPTIASTVTVTAPGPGYIRVDFSAYLTIGHTQNSGNSYVVCALKTNTTSPDASTGRLTGSRRFIPILSADFSGTHYPHITTTGVHQVGAAGSVVLNAICYRNTGSTSGTAFYRVLTATFHPM